MQTSETSRRAVCGTGGNTPGHFAPHLLRVWPGQRKSSGICFQEMVLQLWRSYASFRGQSSFTTWMYRVALNTALLERRKAARRPRCSHGGEVGPQRPGGDAGPRRGRPAVAGVYPGAAVLGPRDCPAAPGGKKLRRDFRNHRPEPRQCQCATRAVEASVSVRCWSRRAWERMRSNER